jgi:hypothetical protein
MAPTRSALLRNHANRSTNMAMAFRRLKMAQDPRLVIGWKRQAALERLSYVGHIGNPRDRRR